MVFYFDNGKPTYDGFTFSLDKGKFVVLVLLVMCIGFALPLFNGDIANAELLHPVKNAKMVADQSPTAEEKAAARKHFELGVALAREGKWGGAAVEYYKAIGEDDTLAEAHTNLGVALAQNGRTEKAIPHHVRAIELNPKLPQARVNLAVELAHIGRYSDAWAAVHAAQDLGHIVNDDFLKLLAARFPDPRKK